MNHPTDSEVSEAKALGVDIAATTLALDDIRNLATYGYKGITGYEHGSELDFVCRCAAQDEAKRIEASL